MCKYNPFSNKIAISKNHKKIFKTVTLFVINKRLSQNITQIGIPLFPFLHSFLFHNKVIHSIHCFR